MDIYGPYDSIGGNPDCYDYHEIASAGVTWLNGLTNIHVILLFSNIGFVAAPMGEPFSSPWFWEICLQHFCSYEAPC